MTNPVRFAMLAMLLLAACGGGGGGSEPPAHPITASPTFSVPAGTYIAPVDVELSSPTSGAVIRYTVDGTLPSNVAGTLYAGTPVHVASTATLRAVATAPGAYPSPVAEAAYAITGTVAPPVFNVLPGTYTVPQAVSISTATAGASIRFTIDNTIPTPTHGTAYSGAVVLGMNTSWTLKAVAYKQDWGDSPVAAGTFRVTGTVGIPVFGVAPGTYTSPQGLTITSSNPAATIRYTTDGVTPTRQVGTVYSGPILLGTDTSTTVRAIAFQDEWIDSPVAAGTFVVTGTVATPTFYVPPGTYTTAQDVILSCATGGASIRYTLDGSFPTRWTGIPYSAPIRLPADCTVTIRALAFRDGWIDSLPAAGTYTMTGQVAAPRFSIPAGSYPPPRTVALTTTTPGAVIRYTVDGTAPTSTTGALYTGAISLPEGAFTTVRAAAFKAGWDDSSVATASYEITGTVSAPVFDTPPGTYPGPVSVAISTATPGAAIRYTTDGTTPSSTHGTGYASPVQVGAGKVVSLRAVAYRAGWGDSPVASGTWTVPGTAATPRFSPPPGRYATLRSVAISSETPGATIYYSTDGTPPTPETGTPYTAPIMLGGPGSSVTIRAVARRDGWEDSPSAGGAYSVSGITAAGGTSHTLFLRSDGTVWAWGGNDNCQLGDGTTLQRSTPVPSGPLPPVRQVAAGAYHSVALAADGTVWTWGSNHRGQLGDNAITTGRGTPSPVDGLSGIVAVTAGWNFTVAVREDGTVFAWGGNEYGQLGRGDTADSPVPAPVPALSGVTAAAAGFHHVVALHEDGTLSAWGTNTVGQLGDGTTSTMRGTPAPVSGIARVVSVAGGPLAGFTMVLRDDGTVWGWGSNWSGQLGDGTTTNRSTPVLAAGLPGITAIALGSAHSLAVASDGSAWSWGYNNYGQFGDDTTTNRTVAARIRPIPPAFSAASGAQHVLVLGEDNTVWSCGWNNRGQLGDGTTTDRHIPVTVMAGGTPFTGGVSALLAPKGSAAGSIGGTGGGGCSTAPGDSSDVWGAAALAAALLGARRLRRGFPGPSR